MLLLLLLSLSLSVDAALDVDMKLVSSRVAMTAEAMEVAVVVTPKQPKLKQLALETLVDTSGATVLSGLVRWLSMQTLVERCGSRGRGGVVIDGGTICM